MKEEEEEEPKNVAALFSCSLYLDIILYACLLDYVFLSLDDESVLQTK